MSHPSHIKHIGQHFIELQSVDSTNIYARALISADLAQDGACIFAHEQTAGRGQRGKKWIAEKGANIAVTTLLKPDFLSLSQQFWLSTCVAVSAHQWLQKYLGDDLKIKWPNDLYWQDRKAGGILIESVIGSNWLWAIIGVGVNVNQTVFPELATNAVSIKQITGKTNNPVALSKEFCTVLETNVNRLIKNGFDEFYAYYQNVLFKKNEWVSFKKQNRIFEAKVKSVTRSGRLLIEHIFEEEIDFGEVEWIIR